MTRFPRYVHLRASNLQRIVESSFLNNLLYYAPFLVPSQAQLSIFLVIFKIFYPKFSLSSKSLFYRHHGTVCNPKNTASSKIQSKKDYFFYYLIYGLLQKILHLIYFNPILAVSSLFYSPKNTASFAHQNPFFLLLLP